MRNVFIEYPKCSTCKKAKKWLEENNIEYFDIKNKPLTDIGSILPIIEKDGV